MAAMRATAAPLQSWAWHHRCGVRSDGSGSPSPTAAWAGGRPSLGRPFGPALSAQPVAHWWRLRRTTATSLAREDRRVTLCRASFRGLPTRLVVAGVRPRPSLELATVAATLRGTSSSPAMPSTCPSGAALGPQTMQNQWSAADNHRQRHRRSTHLSAGSVTAPTSLTTMRSNHPTGTSNASTGEPVISIRRPSLVEWCNSRILRQEFLDA
jgi:hypothetical protein